MGEPSSTNRTSRQAYCCASIDARAESRNSAPLYAGITMLIIRPAPQPTRYCASIVRYRFQKLVVMLFVVVPRQLPKPADCRDLFIRLGVRGIQPPDQSQP